MTNHALSEQFIRTYRIPNENMLLLRHKLEKFSKRAEKLGFPSIQLKVIASEPMTVRKAERQYHTVLHTVEVSGTQPILTGWSFRGKIEYLEDGGTLVKSLGDNGIPQKFWDEAPCCDHCHSSRNRRHVMILQNEESGEFKRVGSQCLKDFLNHDDPHTVANYSQSLIEMDAEFHDLDEDRFNPGGHSDHAPLHAVLTLAAATIRQDTFISAQRAEELICLSTGKLVSMNLFEKTPSNLFIKPAPCDELKADTVEAWLLSDDFEVLTDGSPYHHNLQSIARLCMVKSDQVPLMASSVMAFDKHMMQVERERSGLISRHIGAEGEKLPDLEVTIKFKTVVPGGQWGGKILYVFEDNQSNVLTWYCSGKDLEIPENTKVHLNGTVKKHGEYKGAAQTELTRVKINENEIYPMVRSIHRMNYAENKPAQKLLKRPININMRYTDDLTLLDLASLYNPSFIRPLIELGANACLQDSKGNVPAPPGSFFGKSRGY